MKQSFDVLVAGGGPGGSTIALDLSRRGFLVAIIEQTAYENFRVGETVPPEIRKLLAGLGVWEQFLASERLESYGIRSAWETPAARHHDFLYNPYGCGWHIDRARFDAMLASAAEHAGAELMVSARITAIHQDPDGAWRLEVAQEGKRRMLRGRWLVDATGRKTSIAGKLGCRATVVDHLIGVVALRPRSENAQWTLIEAVENGWWYSAPLPGARTVFAYMTDSDLWRASQWEELLKAASLTSDRASVIGTWSPVRVFSAASMLRRPVAGPNWIVVGDAAFAVDPLSGLGIYKTIEAGLRSAAVVARAIEGDLSGMVEYENWTVESFRSYLAVHHQFYSSVERWPGSSFWQRRMAIAGTPVATGEPNT